MLLAQAEPVAASGLMDFAGKFGFPALLVLVLLYGIYKMLDAARTEREKRDAAQTLERETREIRDEKREDARRVEREADRKAHVDALAVHTASLNTLGLAVVETGHKVDSLIALREQELRLVAKGG